jgi:hypothetical protein
MVEDVERFQPKLQVSLAFDSHGKVLEHRKILIVNPRISQIEARKWPNHSNSGNGERAEVDGRAVPR